MISWNIDFYNKEDGESPVEEALHSFPKKAAAKIIRWLDLLEEFGLALSGGYVEKLKGYDLWELKVTHAGSWYRIFFFLSGGRRLTMLHAFQKKSNKTPQREIETALRRKADCKFRVGSRSVTAAMKTLRGRERKL